MKHLPINMQSIPKLLAKSGIYVDKTDMLYNLINQLDETFFLTRPRRFGKSLTISTLEQIFKGNKELFKGLAIYKSDYDWQEYPVIRLDMTSASQSDFKSSIDSLITKMTNIAKKYNIPENINVNSPVNCFEELIIALSEKYNQSVVILIDEYDKPITDRIPSNIDIAKQHRDFLREFYGILKSQQDNIRFAFLTGVSKFSKAGVFSGLNSVTDISRKPEYASLCGYTKEELEDNFKPFIDELAKVQGLPKEQLLEQMQLWYNGYRFSSKDLKVYNPYSILQLLSNKEFGNYWFSSGLPRLLIDELGKENRTSDDFSNKMLRDVDFESYEIDKINLLSLMYYTGYLTIKDVGEFPGSYIVDCPNLEIKESLNEHILLSNLKLEGNQLLDKLFDARKYLRNKEFDKLQDWMYQIYASLSYQDGKVTESYFKGIFQAISVMLSFVVSVEERTNKGRIDAVITDPNDVYIFEFKVNASAKDAIKQILDKKYYEKFENQGKKIYLIGISFSLEDRNISQLEAFSLDEALKI